MKKEIGKWLMDISKYVITGVLITSLINDFHNQSWVIYLTGVITAATALYAGIILYQKGEQKELNKKKED